MALPIFKNFTYIYCTILAYHIILPFSEIVVMSPLRQLGLSEQFLVSDDLFIQGDADDSLYAKKS
jgi:hypothetical protein